MAWTPEGTFAVLAAIERRASLRVISDADGRAGLAFCLSATSGGTCSARSLARWGRRLLQLVVGTRPHFHCLLGVVGAAAAARRGGGAGQRSGNAQGISPMSAQTCPLVAGYSNRVCHI